MNIAKKHRPTQRCRMKKGKFTVARARANLTFRELSKKVGISASTLYGYHRGDFGARYTVAKELCDALGVAFEEIWDVV